jgi:cell division inhibitor SepF
MAGFMKKVTNFLIGAGNEEYDDYDDDYEDNDYIEDEYESQSHAEIRDISPRPVRGRGSVGASRSKLAPNVIDLHKRTEINICMPKNIEDARDVIDNTKMNVISVVNLEGVDSAIAQRIADFLSGSVDALDGNIRRLSNDMFVIAPSGVEVSGELAFDIDRSVRTSSAPVAWATGTAFS